MAARRILITGVSNFWGARLAALLADDPAVERVVGLDTRPPPAGVGERITFVDADIRTRELGAILRMAAPDAVVHNDILQFPEPGRSARQLHDINVVGTLQLLAALGDLPTLRTLVVRGAASIYGSEPSAPAFFTEDMARRYPLRTRWQRDVGELEKLVEAFARRRPAVTCTVLRQQPVIGPTLDTPVTRLFRAPVVPTFMGFDPRVQLLHEDDSVAVLAHAVHAPVRGPVNVAGPGAVSLARMLRRLGRPSLPLAGPLYGPVTGLAGRLLGLPRLTEDIVRYLRYGRGVALERMERDLRYTPRFTTVQTIEAVA